MSSEPVSSPAARARELVRQRTDTREASARGLGLADIVDSLGADPHIVAAAALYPLAEHEIITAAELETFFDGETVALTRELVDLGSFRLPATRTDRSPAPAQAEALRKMLLAIVADPRLVLVRLAEQLHLLRSLKRGPVEKQRGAAQDTRAIYAPLASRLGIWQLKWELEDLAFRYLDPPAYKAIAAQLRERRAEREGYIREATATLQRMLEEAGIEASVVGRPKHLYSIWRKMQRKGVRLERVFDLRAVRILVESVRDCYAALGIVHSRWPYIPGEFDDYIATPKDNLYRSLHTAVTGPRGEPLEIQIRTREMHEHAELGVAAHWRYKEGAAANPAFEQKINWLRRLLEPGESDETERDFIDRMQAEIFEDRVYAISPDGDVVDLPKGATPVDFAYHVHTDIGHHCRGARINGRIVPLVQPIRNGDQVEIITARNASPSRDWLIPQLGYLVSGRSRAKVRSWFRRQDQEQHLAEAATGHEEPAREREEVSQPRKPRRSGSLSKGVTVEGVGDLLSQLARCCRPVPPEAISGYITLGRGVSIHKAECANMRRLGQINRERVIAVRWSEGSGQKYPVDLRIQAHDRQGLVRDVSTLLADERIGILGMNTRTDRSLNSADIDLSVEINGLDELSRLLHRLGRLPNVVRVSRTG